MVAVSIVLGLLSAAGFVVSLLALIYPFGRFRTRGQALKAAALCVGTFVLSPVVGAVGMIAQGEVARVEAAVPSEGRADAGEAGSLADDAAGASVGADAPEEAVGDEAAAPPVSPDDPARAAAAPGAVQGSRDGGRR